VFTNLKKNYISIDIVIRVDQAPSNTVDFPESKSIQAAV